MALLRAEEQPVKIGSRLKTPDQAQTNACIFGSISRAVISSLASMLISDDPIVTMDIYRKHIKQAAVREREVKVGSIATVVLVKVGYLIAPQLGDLKCQGFISPDALSAFIFGLFVKKAPADAGLTALVAAPLIYGILYIVFNDIAVLNRMAITFVLIPIFMVILTVISALPVTWVMPTREGFAAIPDSKIVGL